MNRKEWLKERMKGIGGSEASAVIGQNNFMSNQVLWMLKTGRMEAKDISNLDFVKYGIDAEAPHRELFALDYPQYKVSHDENLSEQHHKYPFIRASLDGKLIEKKTGRKGMLEIKTTNLMNGGQWRQWDKKIPQNYFCQVLHCMNVTQSEFAVLRASLKSVYDEEVKIEIKHYHIERSDVQDDIDFLEKKVIHFWNEYVLKDIEPPLILPQI